MTTEAAKKRIAPDIVSDVAMWGDRKALGKDIKDLTPEELERAEALEKELPPLPHERDRP